jgi:hypothetical protein
VFVDNRAESVEGSADLESALGGAIDVALERAESGR